VSAVTPRSSDRKKSDSALRFSDLEQGATARA
jgi:hypothetical protein